MKKIISKRHLLLYIPLLTLQLSAKAQMAVGTWRDCPDLTNIHMVEAADGIVYGAGNTGILCYDTQTGELTTLSRSTGLSSGSGIERIAYDTATASLVIAYTNSDIDILQRKRIYNLSDLKRSNLSANKEIHAITFADSMAYLSTGFGVVEIDLKRREVSNTWFLGPEGTQTAVYGLAFSPDSIYAATAQGMIRIARSEHYPAIADRWESDNRLGGNTVDHLFYDGRRLWAAAYTYDPEFHTVYTLDNDQVRLIDSGLLASIHPAAGVTALSINETVFTYDSSLTAIDTHSVYTWSVLKPNDATMSANGTLWVANPWDGIIGIHPDGSDEVHRPDSPASGDNVYRLVSYSNRMMLCPGGHTDIYVGTYIPANLYTAQGRHWQSLDASNGMLENVHDVVDVAVNPRDTNETIMAMWGTGLASIRNQAVQTIYTDTNTNGALSRYTVGSYTTLRPGSIAFDRRGNLWVAVSNTTHALVVRRPDGTWQNFSTAALSPLLQVDKLVCDSVRGYIWMAGRDNAIYVHDGDSRLARINPNNGSKLQTESVNAIVQDQNGNIWVGTNKGIKVIYDAYNAFKNGGTGETAPVSCSNITISNGAFAEYLMAYENITAIAVDGANRKWVGTANGGLYLLSANGMEQLLHFTTANSPLFSDKIVAIGIQQQSGEVYVGTERGLQVYRSTATYAEALPADDVHAFPNPVRPGYEGPIAIKGLSRNALVHITDASGHTVFSTQAYGGQAIWYGRNLAGEKVASGVYYVFASDADGGNRSVTKILIVR